MTELAFFKENSNFEVFGLQHLIVIFLSLVFAILLIRWAKKQPEDIQYRVGHYFAVSLAIIVLIWTGIKIALRGFDIHEDLPLHLCNVMAVLLPIVTYTRKRIYYEILFFWVLAGTSHAVITPDLKNGFPNFIFFKYWLVHSGLIIFVFYSTLVYKLRPTLKSVFIAFLTLQIYIALMFIVNGITGANYFYTQGI